MRLIPVVALGLMLSTPWTTPGVAQTPETLASRYTDLVRRYRTGNAQDAVRELQSWKAKDLRRAVQRVAGILRAITELLTELSEIELDPDAAADRADLEDRIERASAALSSGRPVEGPPVRRSDAARTGATGRTPRAAEVLQYLHGAVGLHTEVAAASWRSAASSTVVEHIVYATAYFPDLLVALDPAYARLWCRVGGALLSASDRYGAALEHYERCLTWHPRDPWLLLGRGSTFESAASLTADLPSHASLVGWPERDVVTTIENAVRDFDAALAQAPDLVEARIRRARLHLKTGEIDAAVRQLSRALGERLPPVPAYWAHLFLGAAEERATRPEEALAHYRRALALFPNALAASIALSHLLAERFGFRDKALTVLRERIAAAASRRFSSDPWWFYRLGQAWRAPEWLDELERRSRQ